MHGPRPSTETPPGNWVELLRETGLLEQISRMWEFRKDAEVQVDCTLVQTYPCEGWGADSFQPGTNCLSRAALYSHSTSSKGQQSKNGSNTEANRSEKVTQS